MSDATELRSLVKQLQNAPSDEESIGILQTLKKEARITEALLRESKAGLAVGKLRTHSSKAIADLAKEIVKQWKGQVEKEKIGKGGAGGSHHSKPAGAVNGKHPGVSFPAPPSVTYHTLHIAPVAHNTRTERKNSLASQPPHSPAIASPTLGKGSSPLTERSAKGDGISLAVTGDKTRDTCIGLIYDSLASDSGAPSELILKRAKAVEAVVLSQHDGTNAAYKAKIRSLYVNLKDKHNPGLRESIVSGDLSAEKFCKMTSQEMASEERKSADNKIKQDNLFHSLGAAEQQAETDAFQCGRCKQRKCRYRQAQTRSADEPMTTFVTCTVCNNRWKFS
ncbi:hypothetical protein JAAARDRAFT_210488 [Jaapia argillacea MUCL 33604]|uniref:Transcription elongation factor n=1 Tax=Jaapia argillacea MUCL 33604 TaxID=933084 RepID=A0A067PQE0_9AGAM|nr:hypothetical protein JAAARDRAFT_210488 [Jaapia argillacea MUCL 33604]